MSPEISRRVKPANGASLALRKILERHPILRALASPVLQVRRTVLRGRNRRLEHQFDRLFDNVRGGSLIVEFEGFPGHYGIDARSDLIRRALISKKFEPELAAKAKTLIDPGADVIDVGANIGLFTVLFSGLLDRGGRVLAIEPTANALGYLRDNLRRNGCLHNTIVYEGVAAERPGKYALNRIPGKEEYSSLGPIVHPAVRGVAFEADTVEGETIDALVAHFELGPCLLKIDAEGAEAAVLAGASSTLAAHHPVIMMELSERLLEAQGSSSRATLALLEKHGYRCFDAVSDIEVQGEPPSGNLIALPSRHRLVHAG